MRPEDVPVLPGYLTSIDVQARCGFASRQTAVNLLLSDALPAGSVFRAGPLYLVKTDAFERYMAVRTYMISAHERIVAAAKAAKASRRAIRTWAEANGIRAPKRGPFSETLVEQYRLAQTGEARSAARTHPG